MGNFVRILPERTVVLSDLHLSPPGPLAPWSDSEPLCRLLDGLARQQPPPVLLFLGDTFDFLKVEGYSAFSIEEAPHRLRQILTPDKSPTPASPVVTALRRLLCAGGQILFLIGEHEAELHLASVQKELLAHLGAAPGQCSFYEGNTPLLWEDGLHRVLLNHGHNLDPLYRWDLQSLRYAEKRAQEGKRVHLDWPLGLRLEAKVLHPLLPRWPILGCLGSDFSCLFPCLFFLAPRQTVHLLSMEFGLDFQQILASLSEPESLARLDDLLQPIAESPQERDHRLVREALEKTLRLFRQLTGLSPYRFDLLLKAFFSAGDLEQRQAERENFSRDDLLYDAFDVSVLLGSLACWEEERHFFDPHQPDPYVEFAARFARHNSARTVVLAHTHSAKDLRWNQEEGLAAPQVHYLNTGTWLPLFPLYEYFDRPDSFASLLLSSSSDPPGRVFPTWVELTPGQPPALHLRTD